MLTNLIQTSLRATALTVSNYLLRNKFNLIKSQIKLNPKNSDKFNPSNFFNLIYDITNEVYKEKGIVGVLKHRKLFKKDLDSLT